MVCESCEVHSCVNNITINVVVYAQGTLARESGQLKSLTMITRAVVPTPYCGFCDLFEVHRAPLMIQVVTAWMKESAEVHMNQTMK